MDAPLGSRRWRHGAPPGVPHAAAALRRAGGEHVREALRTAARAVVPVACPGCGLEDVRWCEACAAPWWDPPWRCEEEASRLVVAGESALPLWAIAALDGPAHGAVVAWKDGGRRDLDAGLAAAMTRAAREIAPALATLPAPIAVVPAPARPASTRRRGTDLPLLLARAATRGLAQAGVASRVTPVLAIRSGESRGASAAARWRESRAAVYAVGTIAPGAAVVLVDDVVTTGATLAACARALADRGSHAVAGLVLAAARRVADPARTGLR